MEIQERDKRIIEFINNFKVTNLAILTRLFFSKTNSYEACRKRLKKLHEAQYVSCIREGFGRECIYYKKGARREALPEEERKLILSCFHSEMALKTKGVITYLTYTKVNGVPFDQIVYFYYKKRYYVAFVNVSVNKNYPYEKIENLVLNNKEVFTDFIKGLGKCDGYLFIEVSDKVTRRKGTVGVLNAKVEGCGLSTSVDIDRIIGLLEQS